MIGGKGLLKMKRLIYQIKPPCHKCPYRLGTIKTVINPCPGCRLDGYQPYERFRKQIQKQ